MRHGMAEIQHISSLRDGAPDFSEAMLRQQKKVMIASGDWQRPGIDLQSDLWLASCWDFVRGKLSFRFDC